MEKKCLSEMEYRNRIQINKSHGFLRDSLPPEGPWWTAPTRPNPTPLPHPRTLPNLLPLSYLITEVLQFEYLDLLLDLKLTMHLATTEAIRCTAHGQSVTVSYSLRYDKKRSQLTPTQSLCLWKSTVLPHFLQNLRYIQSTTDVTKLQTSLNLSLARALHVYGDHTALLADVGVPPLNLIQYTHLAQFHFRLPKAHSDTLPATLFKTFNKPLSLHNVHPSTLDYRIRNSLHQLHINPLVDILHQMICPLLVKYVMCCKSYFYDYLPPLCPSLVLKDLFGNPNLFTGIPIPFHSWDAVENGTFVPRKRVC